MGQGRRVVAPIEGGVPDPISRPTMSVEDAGRIFGMGRSSAYEAVRNGDLPVIRIGKKLVVSTAVVRRMLSLDSEELVAR